jgi:hypothetical protein
MVRCAPLRDTKFDLSGGPRAAAGAILSGHAHSRASILRARGHVMALSLKSLGTLEFGEPGSVNRAEVIFNDAPLPLARWPNEGFATDMQTAGGEPLVSHGVVGDRSGVLAYAGDRALPLARRAGHPAARLLVLGLV